MSDQDARILPRLYATLDTIELDKSNPGEVFALLAQIRRIKGKTAFSGAPGAAPASSAPSEEISLALGDRTLEVRLRGIAIMLERVHHRRPEIAAAMNRIRLAFTVPNSKVQRADLLALIVVMKDLIDARPAAATVNVYGNPGNLYANNTANAANGIFDEQMRQRAESLKEAMKNIHAQTWPGR